MPANDESALLDTEVHYLSSDHVGEEFKILIGHADYGADATPIVLYLLDAILGFGAAFDITRYLRLPNWVPPILIVGISYHVAGPSEAEPLRARDLTPSVDADLQPLFAAGLGRADRFLAFIRDELMPWVAARYPVNPDDNLLFGHSFGGVFGLHVLLSEPALFRRYCLSSPSLFYDNEVLFRREEEYAALHDDLPAKVFMSAGGYERPEFVGRVLATLSPEERARAEKIPVRDMVGNVERMAERLRSRAYPSLVVESEVIPGEFHNTVPFVSLGHGLRFMFDAPR